MCAPLPLLVFRLWSEDLLLRRPRSPLPVEPDRLVMAVRQPLTVSPLPARELLTWLAGGRFPLLVRGGGRWLEFHRPLDSTPARRLLLLLLGRWVPDLIRRDLPPRFRLDRSGAVTVLRHWGELKLPLIRDYYGLRLAVRFQLPRLTPLLLTLFRLRP